MSRTAHRSRIAHMIADPGQIGEPSAIAYFEDGGLLVENGKVVACDHWDNLKPDPVQWHITQHENALILPGFVDTHIHYPQTDIIGGYGEHLLQWLKTHAFPVEEKIGNDLDYATETAAFFCDELLKNGTTSALVFGTVHKHSIDALFEAALSRNMRLIAGKVLMDQNAPAALCETVADGRKDTLSLIHKWQNKGRLGYALTPRFALTSSLEQLEDAGKILADHPDILLHTHLSENEQELIEVQKAFPDHDDYLSVYERAGLLSSRSVFAHCIHLTNSEKNRIARAGASIAFCPTSNLFLGSGLFDLRGCRQQGIHVGLGTDIGAGTSFSLLATQSEAYKIGQLRNETLHPFEAFYLATLGGAKALHIDHHVGNFETGKEADFVVLNRGATPLLSRRLDGVTQIRDMLFAFSILGDDRAIRQTWLAGVKSDL